MRVIKEYLLDKTCIIEQTIYLPKNAEVVAVQNTSHGLFLQAISDFTEPTTELRTFKICSADENVYADRILYIDNFEGPYGRKHVIEILKADQEKARC